MKPNDANGNLPPHERPFRVLVIAGSNRRQYNCPGVDSKARAMMVRMAKRLPQEWEIDVEDLGNVYARSNIRSCNACVSTAMALCVWPCNCYEKNSLLESDLMWDLDMYARLDLADAWAFIGPVNWYAPSSNLKLMFDRLVCMSGGNPKPKLIAHKDPEQAMKLEKTDEWKKLSVNHLEGRTAGFFCYGDGGGDELDAQGRPKALLHKAWFDPKQEPFDNMRDAYAPLVWQCRYSGVEVPDALWRYAEFGNGKGYSENQSEHIEPSTWSAFHDFVDTFASFVKAKGKVPPNDYRAFGVDEGGHLLEDAKLAWRDLRMRFGKPRAGSSPAVQQAQGLNDDITLRPGKGEGAKVRDK